MIFAVLPFDPRPDLAEKLKELGAVYECQIQEAMMYLIHYAGTTQEVSKKLGILDGNVGSALVMPVSNYSGFASPDLWEWLRLHKNGEQATTASS